MSNQINLKKISKSQARYWYNKGIPIYFNPSKMRLFNHWTSPCEITNKNSDEFDNICNHFHYYNCTKETELVIHFYIEQK